MAFSLGHPGYGPRRISAQLARPGRTFADGGVGTVISSSSATWPGGRPSRPLRRAFYLSTLATLAAARSLETGRPEMVTERPPAGGR